ncbi:MAG: hypothetical protein K6253_02020 [Candidatus Liberibacter asiaticus]|nr:hypothetical protein [Candidatus Liberibacter asiaticus]
MAGHFFSSSSSSSSSSSPPPRPSSVRLCRLLSLGGSVACQQLTGWPACR